MATWNPLLTPFFSPAEMACKCGQCGGLADMDHAFMLKLQAIRDQWGPMAVTSGYRCPAHPVEAKKAHPGAHAQGLAADVAVTDARKRFDLVRLAYQVGMVGIGTADGFIHLDGGHAHAARPAMWKYA